MTADQSDSSAFEEELQKFLPLLVRVGLEPRADELADALWLATYITFPPIQEKSDTDKADNDKDTDSKTQLQSKESSTSLKDTKKTAKKHSAEQQKIKETELYPQTSVHAGTSPARALGAPAVPMLPDAINLGRALRLLHRKIPSRIRKILDEEATVEQIADQGLWQPVLKGIPERWFELALVIDRSRSMEAWQPTLKELRRLFAYNGAFRLVRTWYLESDDIAVKLYAGGKDNTQRLCRPEELLEADARRLILVVSDCIGRAWHSGSAHELLQDWAQSSPLAILHMLPPSLWSRTALGRGDEVRLLSPNKGMANIDLLVEQTEYWDADTQAEEKPIHTLKLPVLTLEADTFKGWANFLNGKTNSWMSGIVFTSKARFSKQFGQSSSQSEDEKNYQARILERLETFCSDASEPAQQLAAYLAAVPLTLHIMRLVQQVMLPYSRQIHLAEVMASGLLRKINAKDESIPEKLREELEYEFHYPEEVRKQLLGLVPALETTRVLTALSDYVAEHTGKMLDFRALLADPTASGEFTLDEKSRYFATIGARVLRRLGGSYSKLADRLEGKSVSSPYPSESDFQNPEPEIQNPEPDFTPFLDVLKSSGLPGPEMISLEHTPLKFKMGSEDGADDEKPVHEVTLSPFAIAKYSLTVGEFRQFIEATDYQIEKGAFVYNGKEWNHQEDANWQNPYFEQSDANPVVCVSWNDAQAYCQWLTEQTGEEYRLLTEAEWEYACRAGSDKAYCFGEDESRLEHYAWYSKNSDSKTHPVGQKEPNAFGLHDMHGNVWEWVNDWFDEGYYKESPGENPKGPEGGSDRVIRGGCWVNPARFCRSAIRFRNDPANRVNDLGFRLARTNPQPSYPSEDKLPQDVVQKLCDLFADGSPAPAMAWIPGGKFMMGSPESEEGRYDDEGPQHEVTLEGFSIGHYPVTFEEYERFCQAMNKKIPDDEGWGKGKRPIINVSWEDAKEYCDWLSQETGATYTLLTEAQWEYACRVGKQSRYYFGDDEKPLDGYAWYDQNSEHRTHPVCLKKPNDWGLYDLHGNVWEWVEDTWQDNYNDVPVDGTARQGGSDRVVRGGSWIDPARNCRSAIRGRNDPAIRGNLLGFRLARLGIPRHSYPLTLGKEVLPSDTLPEQPYVAGCSDKLKDGSQGPAMVWMEGGTFKMGDDNIDQDSAKPAHEVTLSGFSAGRYPVTFEEYDKFCEATGKKKPGDRKWGRDKRPVINISWEDATAYCEWLSEQTGRTYTLLSEAQWEFACRAGSEGQYCFGDSDEELKDYAWYDGSGGTHQVGEKKPNAWELYDMHGNVWEWCKDWYGDKYYAESPKENPEGPDGGSDRVIRGGSWDYSARNCRSAIRGRSVPAFRVDNLGFRLARTDPLYSYTFTRGGELVEAKESTQEEKLPFTPLQIFRDGDGPEMVYLPGGRFKMGSVEQLEYSWLEETPQHEVTLDHFAIGKYPVTVGEYMRFVKETESHWPEWLKKGSEYHIRTGKKDLYKKLGDALCDEGCPIIGISWEDAVAYCEWLSERTGEVYTLPSEAEWEYACRAGTDSAWSFGDDEKDFERYGWFIGNSENRPQLVGEKEPNRFGLYDMHGNVWEWVNDWYGVYPSEPQINPKGPEGGSVRVVRGGCWYASARYCRSAIRGRGVPANRGDDLGFRLARRIPGPSYTFTLDEVEPDILEE